MDRNVAIWLCGIALGLGLLIGLMPTEVGGASCGSAFFGSNDTVVADMTDSMLGRSSDRSAECGSQTSMLRIPAIGLTLIGAAGLFWLWTSRPINPDRPMRGLTIINERDPSS